MSIDVVMLAFWLVLPALAIVIAWVAISTTRRRLAASPQDAVAHAEEPVAASAA